MERFCALITFVLIICVPLGCDNGKSPTGYGSIDYQSSEGIHWRLDSVAVGPLVYLHGIWGTDPSEVYVCGMVIASDSVSVRGAIWHYDGRGWHEIRSWPNVELTGIFGVSSRSIWVTGVLQARGLDGALILHWDGQRWAESLRDPSAPGLLSIWARNDQDVYAVGYSGAIYHYDGRRWQKESWSGHLWQASDLWGRVTADGKTEIYLAAVENSLGAVVLRKTSSDWQVFFEPPYAGYDFRSIWIAPSGQIYALETKPADPTTVGLLYIYDGNQWGEPDWHGDWLYYNAVRGDDAGHVYVVGQGVRRFDGVAWSHYTDLPPLPGWVTLSCVWSSGKDVFICADGLGLGAALVTDFTAAEPH